jgi:hypothetical protein
MRINEWGEERVLEGDGSQEDSDESQELGVGYHFHGRIEIG